MRTALCGSQSTQNRPEQPERLLTAPQRAYRTCVRTVVLALSGDVFGARRRERPLGRFGMIPGSPDISMTRFFALKVTNYDEYGLQPPIVLLGRLLRWRLREIKPLDKIADTAGIWTFQRENRPMQISGEPGIIPNRPRGRSRRLTPHTSPLRAIFDPFWPKNWEKTR